MSDQRDGGIAWTDETWNPVRGCSRVSEGCRHCYAETMAARFCGPGQPYESLARRAANGEARWTGEVRMVPERLSDPLRWRRPRRVFVNSMSDLFHEKLTNEDIAAVFGVMAAAPQHTFQVLTKRARRMREWFEWARGAFTAQQRGIVSAPNTSRAMLDAAAEYLGVRNAALDTAWKRLDDDAWPLPNVWLGISCEDQESADERIPELLATPAAVRWVSAEPLLAAVNLRPYTWPVTLSWPSQYWSPEEAAAAGATVRHQRQALVLAPSAFLDWVVVGGESGPRARPFVLAWARAIVEQCRNAGTKVFVKQLGSQPSYAPATSPSALVELRLKHPKGGDMEEWPEDLRAQEWPC